MILFTHICTPPILHIRLLCPSKLYYTTHNYLGLGLEPFISILLYIVKNISNITYKCLVVINDPII